MLDETKENAKPEPKEEEKAVNDSKEVEQAQEDEVVIPKKRKAKKEEEEVEESVPEKPKKVSKTSSKKTTAKKEVKEKVTSKSTKKSKKSAPKKSSKEEVVSEPVKADEAVEEIAEETAAEDTPKEKNAVKEPVAKDVKEDEVSEVVKTVVEVEKKEDKPKTKKVKTEETVTDEKPEVKTKEPVAKPQEFPIKDYKAMELEDLVTELEVLVTDAPINRIKDNVDALKSAFNTKFSTLLADQKELFIKEGGNSIDFYFSSPYKSKYNTLLGQFKKKRSQFYNQLEQQFQDNLKSKLDIIEALKDLIDNAEVSTMYSSFKSLQERWRSVGPIPRNKYNDSWQTYHHHVERFYDLLHLSKDLRDLDFKHNLEEKEKLIAKAEDLASLTNVDDAFKELQQLHKIWKEDVGPVQKEIREEVWQRFSSATKVIHDKRHEAFKELKVVFDENTAQKEAIIKEIATFNTEDLHSHSDWQNAIRSVEKLRDDFFKVGRVSRKQNEALWKNFKEATRAFNSGKNNFYKSIKQEQLDNLTKKRALLSQAVSLKDSEDLDGTVEVVKKIQADWKKIGHVPRKYSDKIWKEFKEACNSFFDRYHEVQNEDSKEEIEAFNNKKAFLEDLKSKAEADDFKPSLEEVKGFVKEWKTLGFVPDSMRHVEAKFNKFLEKQLESLKLGKSELVMLKFKIMIDGHKASNNTRKLDGEQIFLRKKIDEITKEMQQLDNNMNFFANTSDDNPLLKKVKKDIQKYKDDLVILKEKIGYIRRA